jgi:hypothetical protein
VSSDRGVFEFVLLVRVACRSNTRGALVFGLRIFLGLILFALAVSMGNGVTLAADLPEYQVAAVIQAPDARPPFRGRLEVLWDSRIDGKRARCFDAICDPSDIAEFREKPLLNGAVRLVTEDGRVLDQRVFERPQVSVNEHMLYGDRRRSYEITVDYSTGMGSYNGPISWFVDGRDGKLQWLTYRDPDGDRYEITVMSSLKTMWRFSRARHGAGKDLLLASCRPNWESVPRGDDFVVRLVRFHQTRRGWTVSTKVFPGYFDVGDGPFPDARDFP